MAWGGWRGLPCWGISKAYLHVELSPRGGALHHPVHHTDQGFALAHLRQTGKEMSEVSGEVRAQCWPGTLRALCCKVPPPRDVPRAHQQTAVPG